MNGNPRIISCKVNGAMKGKGDTAKKQDNHIARGGSELARAKS
jgi:hypothetical protein